MYTICIHDCSNDSIWTFTEVIIPAIVSTERLVRGSV